MERNFIRLDGVIGENLLKKIDNSISKAVDKGLKELRPMTKTDGNGHPDRNSINYNKEIEDMIELRKYILAELLEMWGSWHEKGDCFPKCVRLGRGSEFFASVIIEKNENPELEVPFLG